MARKRNDVRRERKEIFAPVFSTCQTLGTLRRVNNVSLDDGEHRFRQGMAKRVYQYEDSSVVQYDVHDLRADETIADGLAFIGYQFCEAPMPSMKRPSSLYLTRKEMDLVAGQAFKHGKSRTARFGLDYEARERYAAEVSKATKRVAEPEDAVELAVVKLSGMQPGIGLADRMVTRKGEAVGLEGGLLR